MRIYLRYAYLVLVSALVACGTTDKTAQEEMLLGWVPRSGLSDPRFPRFQQNYDSTHIPVDMAELIGLEKEGIDCLVFFGTWCSDSYREVPRFLKIADMAGIGSEQIRFYGLDRTKKSADGLSEKYQIELLPTFIFFRGEREIGRIIEKSRMTLEDDMLVILVGGQGD